MRCKHCGALIEDGKYCTNCGVKEAGIADNTIADYFYWFVLGALLNVFSIILYAYIRKKNDKKAAAVLLGMIFLFVWFGLSKLFNLIFK